LGMPLIIGLIAARCVAANNIFAYRKKYLTETKSGR